MSEEQEKKWCVYIHRNMVNNKAYIGITSQNPKDRWGSNGYRYREEDHQVFYRAIQKYGWDNFEHIIWKDKLTEQEAKHSERLLIALFQTNCTKYRNPEHGYNMTDGGDGMIGWSPTEESRKKMGESQKRRFKNPENHPRYGKHLSDEQKELLSRARKSKLVGADNPNYGNCKPVIQLSLTNEFIKEYRNAIDAEKETGIFATQIYNVCVHKPHYNTAGGYNWKYVYDYTTSSGTVIPGAITLGIITEEEVLTRLNKIKGE